MTQATFRHADGRWPNTLALGTTVLGWPLGIWLLGHPRWDVNVLGVLLVTLTLTWSAYYIHEFAHHAIFRNPQANECWGKAMTWINGSCFGTFEGMRRKHMRHHVERADVITFDFQGYLRRHPLLCRLVLALEWLYVPAVELLMRGFVMAMPFADARHHAGRSRVVGVALVRLAGWALLAWWSVKALCLYVLAYLLFVHLLRFADCFQHTYDTYPIQDDTPIPADKVRDRAYEQANTYSDVVGLHATLPNLIWLNFGFHNAHHERPVAPWHVLPRLHRELYGDRYGQMVTVGELLRAYHRHRVTRVMASDYGEVLPPGTARRADRFVGAVGVSFLTAV